MFGKRFTQGFWMPAAVLLLGSLSIGLLVWTNRINEKQRVDYVVQGALMDVQIRTSNFHLWLEEFIGGNPDVDLRSIWNEFDSAVRLTESVLNGGATEHGVIVDPLKKSESRMQAESIKDSLAELKAVALERLKAPGRSGITSDVNQRFDTLFGIVLTRAQCLEKIVEAERLRNQTSSRHLIFGILSVWTVIVIVAVGGLWSREVRRKKSEQELFSAHGALQVQTAELERRTEELLASNELLNSEIAERKKGEEEISRLNRDLAGRAAELETVNRDLEAFNYSVAHDLKRPLTVVIGYCHALRVMCGDRLDEECREFLQEAYDGTWRMSRLVDTLLNFSRQSYSIPRREPVNLSTIAQEVAAGLTTAEPARKVTFLIAEGITADGDPSLLRIAMENLLDNAWKFSAGREEAVIEFGVRGVGNDRAFFVRDNGAGFAMADADKMFLPFQRLSNAEDYRGSGIGLATVERIIMRHGGRLWASGEPGNGATFYFILGDDCDRGEKP